MAFSIGERVRVKDWRNVGTPAKWAGEKAKLSGKMGNIVDVLQSERLGGTVYKILFDDEDQPSAIDFKENELEYPTFAVEEAQPSDLQIAFEKAESVVVCKVTESGDVIARGHGHIIHEGTLGVLQAASYALKKAYEKYNGGSLRVDDEGRF